MKDDAIAVRHPLALSRFCCPCRSDGCVRTFVIELVKQDAVALLCPFFMLIVERLPNAVQPFVQLCERTEWSVLWQMLYKIPRPFVGIESAASCSVRHSYTLWRTEHGILVGRVVIRFGYAYTFTHLSFYWLLLTNILDSVPIFIILTRRSIPVFTPIA